MVRKMVTEVVCDGCNRTDATTAETEVKVGRVSGFVDLCPDCEVRLVQPLAEVVRTAGRRTNGHTDMQEFICSYCSRSFPSKQGRSRHVTVVHEVSGTMQQVAP